MVSNYADIYKILTKTDFKLRYQNSLLGVFWVLLKPLLLFTVLYVVFSFLFGQKDPNYRLNLFLGIMFLSFFQEGTTSGMYSIFWRANILLKVNFPREIVLSSTLTNAIISLFFNLCVFVIFFIFSPTNLSIVGIIYFLMYVLIMSFLIQGINYFFSILYIKFRDLSSIWEVLTSMLFYLTPVIYPLSVIPEKYQPWALINPLAVIIINARNALITGSDIDLPRTIYVVIFVLTLNIFGYKYFQKNIKNIAEDF